jgi:hypothetical protein
MSIWLVPAIAVESAVPRKILDAAHSIDAVGMVVNGQKWLASAPFDEVQFGVIFVNGGDGKPTYRRRQKVLEVDTAIDPRALPDLDHVGYQWHFFNFAVETLNDLGRRYGLSSPPPLKMPPYTQHCLGQAVSGDLATPNTPAEAFAGVEAELAALEDNEVLVIALRSPTDDESAADARIRKIDARLERRLGSISGSSFLGQGYMWAVAIET